MTINAAGSLFLTPKKEALFLKRSDEGDHPGEWCFPGGKIEDGETAEDAAAREGEEETGHRPPGLKVPHTRQQKDGVDYTTFLHGVKDRFHPYLNEEHTAHTWASVDSPPEPLHPGARVALKRFGMDELDIAKAIRDGELTSPQKYENLWLFAIRITGTGMAYRKSINEYVWREKGIYLNDRFLERCSGLPVIWEHPQKTATLNTEEYADRVIGAVMLSYIDGEDVWSIARIYDAEAAKEMEDNQLSTSPAVVFRDPSVNSKRDLNDGSKLLIEGKPSLLDHIAICGLGVWDKAGPPTGVLNDTLERVDSMATEEEMKAADAARKDADAGQKLDKLLTHLDAFTQRLDALECAEKERKDAFDIAEKAKKDAFDIEEKAKKDAAEAGAKEGAPEGTEGGKKIVEAGDTKEVVADKAKKDAVKAVQVEDPDADGTPGDGKVLTKDSARSDAQSKRIADLEKKLEAVLAATRPIADEDRVAFADEQVRADSVYMALGNRAPAPLSGETVHAYRTRLTRGVQKHSQTWKSVDLIRANPETLAIAQQQIYADAMIAARNPDDVAAGTFREIVKVDPATGQRMITFVGKGTFIGGMKRPARRITSINTKF